MKSRLDQVVQAASKLVASKVVEGWRVVQFEPGFVQFTNGEFEARVRIPGLFVPAVFGLDAKGLKGVTFAGTQFEVSETSVKLIFPNGTMVLKNCVHELLGRKMGPIPTVPEYIQVPMDQIIGACQKTRHCISKEEMRFQLQGFSIDTACTATDGHRLATTNLAVEDDAIRWTLPEEILPFLQDTPAYIVRQEGNDEWERLWWEDGSWIVFPRTRFPEWRKVVSSGKPNIEMHIMPDSIIGTLKQFSKDKTCWVMFCIDGIEIRDTNDKDFKKTSKAMGNTWFPEPALRPKCIQMNPKFLMDAAKASAGEMKLIFTINVNDGKPEAGQVQITTKDLLQVMMPIKY